MGEYGMRSLKKIIQRWLGIDKLGTLVYEQDKLLKKTVYTIENLVTIGVDVGFVEQTQIVIMTKLGGGQVHILDFKFDSLMELDQYVRHLRDRFNTSSVVWDLPKGYRL